MAEFHIRIEATVQARNIHSAEAKVDALKQQLKRKADWVEIHLTGSPSGEKK